MVAFAKAGADAGLTFETPWTEAPSLEVALRHRYAGFTLDAEFTVPATGVTALFGPSGCGKSTTLAAIAGLLRPQAGRITMRGVAMLDTARGICLAPERRGCGVVFQDARLFPHLSVASNLGYGARRAGAAAAAGPGFAQVVALLGLEGLLQRRPAMLSGGEKQRVALGRALLARPRLLLMDEPLAALDAARRDEVLPFLARLAGATAVPILYVTHSLEEVDRLADTMVLMQDGRVVANGPVETLSMRTDLPQLAGRRDAGAVLRCLVAAHLPERGLTRLDFPGGSLLVPRRGEATGTALRLRIQARDVSVATSCPEGLSIHNVLPARLVGVEPTAAAAEVFLRLAVGEQMLLSRVTRDALARLALRPGAALWALLKAASFDQAVQLG